MVSHFDLTLIRWKDVGDYGVCHSSIDETRKQEGQESEADPVVAQEFGSVDLLAYRNDEAKDIPFQQ